MYAVVDIETTGLDPKSDSILEIGIASYTDEFTKEAEASWLLINSTGTLSIDERINRAIQKMPAVVRDMHTQSGLIEDLHSKPISTYAEIATEFKHFMEYYSLVGQPMVGSSVHFDRAFLKEQLPAVELLFHYRNVDVSSFKEVARRYGLDDGTTAPVDRGLHRALPDIEDSMNYLQWFLTKVGVFHGTETIVPG